MSRYMPAGVSMLAVHSDPVERHSAPVRCSTDQSARIAMHVTEHIGAVQVIPQLWNAVVDVDVLVVVPTQERPCFTLVTRGMGAAPMHAITADARTVARYAELMITLPLNTGASLASKVAGMLASLAGMVHEYDTWLGVGHSVDISGTMLGKWTAVLIMPPLAEDPDFAELTTATPRIEFLSVWPLTARETTMKLEQGATAIARRLVAHDVCDVFDYRRKSVV